ncbi:mannonate dehydratase [Ignavigranum ruoffiae]|uniref:mannonate dehydratase n=1 Tax=Ignavigranum ruoffiae TaxID=89093 RepID=UPI00206CF5CF|nr:mannonate dehydratase [Ignavigranum ruoffiae]UPQ86614.1 mannonate dehydratase [Ignavigranum ruoffiae]
MKWTFRWYGPQDTVSLENIKQIPNMHGVVGTIVEKLPGSVWELSEIKTLQNLVEKHGLKLAGIESVSVHDAIKAETSDRDFYIHNYQKTIRNLGKCGVKLICYSFKPIFGWAKTNMQYKLSDGSLTLEYDDRIVQTIEPQQMYGLISGQTSGFQLSGWEPERLEKFQELQKMYEGITEEKLFENLVYFLNKVIPVCEEVGVKMAIHPDDPPFELFDYPRITKNKGDILRIINAVDSPCNGVTFCTGSLGANPENDLVDMVYSFKEKIHFVHFRNVKVLGDKHFIESAHFSEEGSLDMFAIMSALYDIGFDGIVRPDHGRTIWGEISRPGYGLYDRALGLTYLQGLNEAVKKMS